MLVYELAIVTSLIEAWKNIFLQTLWNAQHSCFAAEKIEKAKFGPFHLKNSAVLHCFKRLPDDIIFLDDE